MNYERAYCALVDKASKRVEEVNGDWHHIIPKSIGGNEDNDNLIKLTHREHYLAHLLLFKMGLDNQIFGVEAISKRCGYRLPRWIRRKITFRRALIIREVNKVRLSRCVSIMG